MRLKWVVWVYILKSDDDIYGGVGYMDTILGQKRAEDFWCIGGDFGYVRGDVQKDGCSISSEKDKCFVHSEYKKDDNGVILRKGKVKNISSDSIHIKCLLSKFLYDGGEYEVYTQSNTWQNESCGSWQKVVTSVSAETTGLRNAYGSVPFFAIWNNQTSRGVAFHILTRLPWQFEVKNVPTGYEANNLEITIGINEHNLEIDLASGEEIELPEILYYEIRNKLDLDAYKLHQYMNENYPRKGMPVMYNTWLYKFDRIDFENVSGQIERAGELGVEYFVIDAAWFGQGEMWSCRGDWYENQEAVFCGRMKELSQLVRDAGMKFGFWLEVETAGVKSKWKENYKEYYFTYNDHGNELSFFDFSNPEACAFMFDVVSKLVENYQAEFIKFDFNQDLTVDVCKDAFRAYFKGYEAFIGRLKEAFPNLYLENCASGGLRMTLMNGMDFNSLWISDNHSPYEGMRIYKDTIRRLPPQLIEKWAAIQSICNFSPYYFGDTTEKIITTNDGTWNDVRGIHQSYLEGFLTGGPLGFSCDLNSLSHNLLGSLKEFIVQFKKDREFWKNAVCRILADTESVLVLEYSDKNFEKIELLVYTNRVRQSKLLIYPKIDIHASYCVNGKDILSGAQIDTEGICVTLKGNFTSERVSLEFKR